MLKIKSIFTCAFLMLFSIGNVHAALINVAAGGTATASGSYLSSTPDKAIDGDLGSVWNSGGHPTAWIEIDLGAIYSVDRIDAYVTQLPDSVTNHNVYLDGVFNFSWSGFTSAGDILSETFASPLSFQTIKIETTASDSWVAWREIEVLVDVPERSVPEPGILALLSLGLVGIGYSRRNRK